LKRWLGRGKAVQVGHDVIVREMKRAGKEISNGVRFTRDRNDPGFHLCITAYQAQVAKDEG
jgi:hypothetical protein